MNTEIVEIIEIVLTAVIVVLQVIVFFITFRKIRIFKRAIPDKTLIETSRVQVPIDEINTLSSTILATRIANYKMINLTEPSNLFFSSLLISSKDRKNKVFDNILASINTYLLRNRTSVPDFNLIKDITERNTDTIEEEINLTISIPLYLGLMGTMLGIVIGLFYMPDFTQNSTNEDLGQGISLLLGGVKIAMVGSFFGLLLTTINSGWFLKGSKGQIERRKNEFYSFVQTEFLPVINQSLGSTFDTLQKNLSKFNEQFSKNLGELSKTFESNRESLTVQKEIITEIKNLDLEVLAKFNLDVFNKLLEGTKEFEKINVHIANVGTVLDNSNKIVDGINEFLGRTDNFHQIALNLDHRMAQSKFLLDFLYRHFREFEKLKEITLNSVDKIKNQTTESIEGIGLHATNSIEAVRQSATDTIQEVRKETTESIEGFRKDTAESIEGVRKDTTGSIIAAKEQVTIISSSIIKAFEELVDLIMKYEKRMKEFTDKESVQLEKALTESRTGLGNLHHLETMQADLTLFKDSAASQGERIRQLMELLNTNSTKTNSLLGKIEQNSSLRNLPTEKRLIDYLKKYLSRKTNNL